MTTKTQTIIKYQTSIIGFLLTVLLSLTSLVFINKTLQIFPTQEEYVVYEYNDKSSGGKSQIKIIRNRGVSFSYSLSDVIEYPYAGLSFKAAEEGQLMDLSSYKTLSISLSAKLAKRIPVSLMVRNQSTKTPQEEVLIIPFLFQINYDPSILHYEIPLSKFTVPSWWYDEHPGNSLVRIEDLAHSITTINVENCELIQAGITDEIRIEKLTVQKHSFLPLTIFCLGTGISLLIFLNTFFEQKKAVVHTYTPVTSIGEHEKKGIDCIGFIASNYMDPSLSISSVKKEVGLGEGKITAIVKAKTQQTFKQYLNSLRLSESKRLLKESDKSISEIAYLVGYNNVSHFNRVFKNKEGYAPTDFRNK